MISLTDESSNSGTTRPISGDDSSIKAVSINVLPNEDARAGLSFEIKQTMD